MSNPAGDYGPFVGLGFTGLRLLNTNGGEYLGYLYYEEGENSVNLYGITYVDATRTVTFNAAESPAGITDVNFVGTAFVDSTGNVTMLSGTWTGRQSLHRAPVRAAAMAAAPATSAVQKFRPIGPLPILWATGAWSALNRENTIA
jgi:hypothetical protein